MQRFFFDDEKIDGGKFSVVGEKYNHITRVLRMSVGERAVFCDGNMTDYECTLLSANKDCVVFEINRSYPTPTEPDYKITIFQCVPKGEKFDEMVKRSVQFGVYEIVPVISKRCVSRPDNKSAVKKVERLNKISCSSAMQSMRGIVPKVSEFVDFKTALSMMQDYDCRYICYEDEHGQVLDKQLLKGKNIALLIGPEGGIDESEVQLAKSLGIDCVSLGRRILRTEDAAVFSIPIILSLTDNL